MNSNPLGFATRRLDYERVIGKENYFKEKRTFPILKI
jgi:hypothetical protein